MSADSQPVAEPELVLSHLDGLPTLAPIAVKLLMTTLDDDAGADDLIKLIRADQSLTAKVLSVAGSSAVGARSQIKSLERAVPLLGFAAIRSIVLAVKVFECFGSPDTAKEDRQFDRREFWKHALGVACASKRLAALLRDADFDPEVAFVAGLLHDIGKVALDAVFPKAYDRIAAQADQTRGDIADCERDTLGVDHTIAGRHLAERWGLPQPLQEVIWLHHLAPEALPSSISAARLIATVQLADTLVREQRVGYSGNHTFYEYSPRMASRLGLSDADLSAVIKTLVGDVAHQSALLELDRDTPEALYLKAMTSANAELGRLNTELVVKNRRLSVAARYFQATREFDQRLGAWSDLSAVVAAIARASTTALQRPRVACFGLRERSGVVDLCWIGEDPSQLSARTQNLPAEFTDWMRELHDGGGHFLVPAHHAVRALLAPALEDLGRGDPWLLPIVHDGELAGGVVFLSQADERSRFVGEADDLRSFLAGLGLAIGRCNAHAAARRLADDLADTNRRLQQAQTELLRSRTLSMIAEMAAGAGHELNSPLTVISGRAQMLQHQIDDPDVRRALDTISQKAHECSTIVTELMDFARPRAPRLAPLDLPELLAQVRDEALQNAAMPPSRLLLDVPGETEPPLPPVLADRDQIKAVFHELIDNARHAMTASDGIITIRCRLAASTDALEITVRDAGCGMSPAVLQRAFDPFFSQRSAGRSRGLGLARAHRIVEAHAGRIWLESRPEEGTVAYVVLPADTDRSASG